MSLLLRTIGLLLACSILLSSSALATEVPLDLLNAVVAASNSSLLWGPYRPNLYFGVRPRLPKSLLTGLLWSNVDDYKAFQKGLRHSCEIGDDMASYGWTEYDGRLGGKQLLSDRGMKLDIETEFIKVPGPNGTPPISRERLSGGGNWGVRIRGRPQNNGSVTTVWFYVGLEGLGDLHLGSDFNPNGFDDEVVLEGATSSLGEFSIEITKGPETNRHPVYSHPAKQRFDETIYSAIEVVPEQVWQAKEAIVGEISENARRLIGIWGQDNAPPPAHIFSLTNKQGPGLQVFQKIFHGEFEFDILYNSKSSPQEITSSLISQRSSELSHAFNERFSKVFPLHAPFNTDRHIRFAKEALSSLLGGISYFHGQSLVDRHTHSSYDEEDEDFWIDATAERTKSTGAHLEGPAELFTATPSRPFFPRGFYWDEGFHLLPVGEWDNDLALEVLKSWFSLMDQDGWIAREQILGEESRSKVPEEFQTQYPHYANPPTLLMPIANFVERLKKESVGNVQIEQDVLAVEDAAEKVTRRFLDNRVLAKHYLEGLYPLLQRHHEWFRRTQAGDIKTWDREAFSSKEGYRWRGRTPDHCLTSGLDDYPRARPPHTGELHVDLLSWMGFFAKTLKDVADFLGKEEDVAELSKIETAIVKNLDDLHWSEEHKVYCDATIDQFEENKLVCHKGYISIFPLLLGLVPKDWPHLGALLDMMSDPNQIWSDYGLRSLSKSDEYYGKGENYWRGPIWINMNYMALSSLYKNYISTPGPYRTKAKQVYDELRKNVVENIVKEWERTGFTWEQYDPENGEGRRSHPFDGWTGACALLIAAEVY